MIYESNIIDVSKRLQGKFKEIQDLTKVTRKIAVILKTSNDIRVFTDGKKSDNSQIGTYSASYMKRRVKGTSSKKHTRFTSDTKVILRNEGLLKEDFKVVPISGGWGVAFTTSRSAEIVPHLEARYGDRIWGISPQDEKLIDQTLSDELRNTFK